MTEQRSNAVDLAHAEGVVRAHAENTFAIPGLYAEERDALAAVIAEYDRRGAELEKLRAVRAVWRDLQPRPFVMPPELTELAIALDALDRPARR